MSHDSPSPGYPSRRPSAFGQSSTTSSASGQPRTSFPDSAISPTQLDRQNVTSMLHQRSYPAYPGSQAPAQQHQIATDSETTRATTFVDKVRVRIAMTLADPSKFIPTPRDQVIVWLRTFPDIFQDFCMNVKPDLDRAIALHKRYLYQQRATAELQAPLQRTITQQQAVTQQQTVTQQYLGRITSPVVSEPSFRNQDNVPEPGLFSSQHSSGMDPMAIPSLPPSIASSQEAERLSPTGQTFTLPHRPQTTTEAPQPPTPSSNQNQPRQPRMTQAQMARARSRGERVGFPLPPQRRKNESHPDDRPGGLAPWEPFKRTIPLRDCALYPEDRNRPGYVNDMRMNSLPQLGLYSDEDPCLCYGIFVAVSFKSRCPYSDRPELCRNQHHVEQKILDWCVTNRGISVLQMEFLVGNYRRNTPVALQRSLQVPTVQPFTAATPASLKHVGQSSAPQQIYSQITQGETLKTPVPPANNAPLVEFPAESSVAAAVAVADPSDKASSAKPSTDQPTQSSSDASRRVKPPTQPVDDDESSAVKVLANFR